jgi:hypothetical protein
MPKPPKGFAACRTSNGAQKLIPVGATRQTTHLVALGGNGSNGGRATVCGLTRFPLRGADGRTVIKEADLPGWSMGGGVSGPGVVQYRCEGCWLDDDALTAMRARLTAPASVSSTGDSGRAGDGAVLPGECERCDGSGCDLNMCEECGEEFTDPCARHRSFGHVPSPGGGYTDGVDCSSCCTACRPPAAPPSPPERPDTAQMRADAQWLREWALNKVSFTKAERIEEAADWIDATAAAPVQSRGDELGVLREAVERFYRVDGYPAAMQVVRAAESLLAASPATADRTDGDAS